MYAKLFSSMFTGSLATRGPWQAVVTFQQLLVLADRFGIVDMTPEAIARHTTIPLEIISAGIEALEAPDPDSRRPDADGRRIVRLDPERAWGWEIVNHAHYRQIRSAEERREYQRAYMRDYRKGARRPRTPKDDAAKAPLPPLPDWIPAELFSAWWQAKPKRARTPHAHALAIKRLDELRAQGHEPTATLEHCIRSGYQGIFAPSQQNGKHAKTPPLAGAHCAYCPDLAVNVTNNIPHCARLDHLDFAVARRR